MQEPVLSVHKNTRQRRESKRLRLELKAAVSDLSQMQNISGFALVVWDEDFQSRAKWDSYGSKLPGTLVPELAKQTISRTIALMDAEDLMEGNL